MTTAAKPTAAGSQVQTKPADPMTSVRTMLESNRDAIAAACTKVLSPDRLIRLMFVECRKNPDLLTCTPASLMGACFQMAQLGLEPGPLGLAYIVPYNNKKNNRKEVQFIPGYKGLLELANRSEKIASIQAELVYKDDQFSYSKGLHPDLIHVPNDDPKASKDIKDIKAVYAIGNLLNGTSQFFVMTAGQLEEHKRKYVQAKTSLLWEGDWGPKKTVLRQLCKLLPASTELRTAVALAEMAEADISQHLGALPALANVAIPPDPIEETEGEELKNIQEGLKEQQEAKAETAVDPSLAEEAEVVEQPALPKDPDPISDAQWKAYCHYMDNSTKTIQQLKVAVKKTMNLEKILGLIEPARTGFINTMNDQAKKANVVLEWPKV
jgi:recombination protein RecT